MKGSLLGILFGTVLATFSSEALIRVVAAYNPQINYLANAKSGKNRAEAKSLKEFLENPDFQLYPHTDWYGYAKNNLGLVDAEVQIPKPKGLKRVLAIGDSFTHGAVPYPQNILTKVESSLQSGCGDAALEVVNIGLPGARVSEYKEALEHAIRELEPDYVVVNFYLGNDGPNLLQGKDNLPGDGRGEFHSYLFRYVNNSLRLLRGVKGKPLAEKPEHKPRSGLKGGALTGARADYSDETPPFNVPTIEGIEWDKILRDEISHFFVEPDSKKAEDVWSRSLQVLSSMNEITRSRGLPFAVFLYPSEIQIEPTERDRAIAVLRKEKKWAGLTSANFDFGGPGKVLDDWCQREGVSCFDLSEKIAAAARASGKKIYIPQNTHWNILGNEIAAKLQSESLRTLWCKVSEAQ